MSRLEDMLVQQLAIAGLPEPVREYRFAPGRRFRADLAWPEHRLLVEVQGGVWAARGARRCPACGHVEAGKHGRATGIVRDYEKLNLAAALGWRVVQVAPQSIKDGTALRMIRQALGIASGSDETPQVRR